MKELLVPGVEICDDELVDLVTEIEDYKKSMQVAEQKMKDSTSAFMTAHATMLELLGEAGKVQYKKRFCAKLSRDIKCMFCSIVV